VVCSHALCGRCNRDAFSRHRTVACGARLEVDGTIRACDALIVSGELSRESTETREFAAEKRVRRTVTSVFNALRNDFASDAEWNDYAERTELLIAALVSGSAAEKAAAEAAVAAHRASSAGEIEAAAARRAAESAAASRAAEAEDGAARAVDRALLERAEREARVATTVHVFMRAVALGESRAAASAGGPLAATAKHAGGGAPAPSSTADDVFHLEQTRERLIALRAAQRAAKEKAAAMEANRARLDNAPILQGVPPPRVLSALHPLWSGMPTAALPRDSLRGHWRAAGFDLRAAVAAAEAELNEMLAAA
jgi:hypothetical protein